MPKNHSIIGSQRALIKRMGTQGRGVTVTATVVGSPSNIASIYIAGLTLGNLTQSQKEAFKAEFAAKLRVSANMLILTFTSGSLILEISIDSSKISTKDDNAFVVNTLAVIAQLNNTDISDIITNSDNNASITGTANIDHSRTVVTVDVNLKGDCLSRYPKRIIYNPIVGDDANNCMYSVLNSKIVRIFPNGSMDTICNFPEDVIRNIFITRDSNYLVIPSNIFSEDGVNPLGQSNLRYVVRYTNKIYVIKISDGSVYTNLISVASMRSLGFNQYNNRFYYNSAETSSYQDTYYVEILFSASNVASILLGDINSLESVVFIDANTGIFDGGSNLQKINMSTNEREIIAGVFQNGSLSQGKWDNANFWLDGAGGVYSPFLDNLNGSNAFFVSMGGICFDAANNRILVTDMYAQRIRSVDLTSGNNYAVTTLAGTSPVKYGNAINGPQTNFSPQVLASLGQVGLWDNPISGMPRFEKVNSTYALSTFDNPYSICLFDNKILVLDSTGTRVLSNGHVNDFTVMGR